MSMSKYDAPKGALWVCAACGKKATNRADGGVDRGWDASCFLNAVLCNETPHEDGLYYGFEGEVEDVKVA